MTDFVKAENIKSFSPLQHNLQPSEELIAVKNSPDDVFTTQSSNLKVILSNTLDNSELKKINGLANIPDEIGKIMFNGVAQKQLEKAMYEMRGKKFSREFDDVSTTPDSPML